MNVQLKQLDEANQAWQQYQQNQLILLRDRLKLTDMDNSSFEDIVQQIENRFDDLNNQLIELQDAKKIDTEVAELQQGESELQSINTQAIANTNRQSTETQTEEKAEILIQHVAPAGDENEDELRQLRESLAALTTQRDQLDEANRAWQLYHQTQLDNFKDRLQPSLSFENSLSFDDIAQQLVTHINQLNQEHETISQQLQTAEKLHNDLRSGNRQIILPVVLV